MENFGPTPVVRRSSVTSISSTPTSVVAAEAHSAGVSWGAVFGGAFVTAAFSLILLSLGTGLGLASVSPWANRGASAATISAGAIAWLILMQLIAASMGGYLAGRLRQRWPTIHTDEVYFRDTAHGFLSWAVAIVITTAFLASAATAMIGDAVQSGANATTTAGAVSALSQASGQAIDRSADPNAYFVDMLFRSDHVNTDSSDAAVRMETGRIFANMFQQDDISAADRAYLGQLVSARTGLSLADADQRVSDVIAQARAASLQARQAVDAARKAASHLSLWMFAALLIGAFSACVAATIGGSQRDRVVVI